MSAIRRLDRFVVDRATQAVADAFGVSPQRLLGRRRDSLLPEARFALFTLLRESGDDATYSAIGRLLGLDHATISHGVARARDLAGAYRDYAEKLAAARAGFTGTKPRSSKRFPWL